MGIRYLIMVYSGMVKCKIYVHSKTRRIRLQPLGHSQRVESEPIMRLESNQNFQLKSKSKHYF